MASDVEQRFNEYLKRKEAEKKQESESNGYTKFATSLLTFVIMGAYIYGALWLLQLGNLFFQTIGVMALLIALLILQTAILKEAIKKHV